MIFELCSDLGRMIVEDFLRSSRSCVEAIVKELSRFRGERRQVNMFYMKGGRMKEIAMTDERFYIRSSVEYSYPQLTVEEVQGIVAARLLEVCGNYFDSYGLKEIRKEDVNEICEELRKPSLGKAVSFLLNTDDVEPDRYSINPLRESIVESNQSAFPSASVKTEGLRIDSTFMQKYRGSLISEEEAELIDYYLGLCNNNYMDLVDAVKYEQLEILSKSFGIDLCIPSIRMPLTVLKRERTGDLLHFIIRESHKDYGSVKKIYDCLGRSMKKRTTLLTIPHSEMGFGSKRSARGKIYFEDSKLKRVRVTYRTTPLYPNAMDPKDVSIARADDKFIVDAERLKNYDFHETPSSPQFTLYSICSPEDAVLWHGIGAFGATELVRSYTSIRLASARSLVFGDLKKRYGLNTEPPLQFNLVPKKMWTHPIHDNIDASIGCIGDLKYLEKIGMKLEFLPTAKYSRI